MLVLTIRTDKPESEIGLYLDDKQLGYETWQAHRQLAETIHVKIKELLNTQAKDWADIEGVVVYRGPGSFTGLRIGLSVANALADSLGAAIVGVTGESWQMDGLVRLQAKENEQRVMPEYGADVHITLPKK
jgi:tRNA threonylcarbamoyladenosine biosynthesis protein TsaB